MRGEDVYYNSETYLNRLVVCDKYIFYETYWYNHIAHWSSFQLTCDLTRYVTANLINYNYLTGFKYFSMYLTTNTHEIYLNSTIFSDYY